MKTIQRKEAGEALEEGSGKGVQCNGKYQDLTDC